MIRALSTGEKITHEGAYYQSHQAKLYTLPGQPIPLYVSTMVPNSAHFAGKYGSGLITVGGGEPEMYRQILENFETGAREAGKDPSRMPRIVELAVAYTDDEDKAIECGRLTGQPRLCRRCSPKESTHQRWLKKTARS